MTDKVQLEGLKGFFTLLRRVVREIESLRQGEWELVYGVDDMIRTFLFR
jgi:hypothetical protein